MSDMIELLTGGLTGMATGIGGGLKNLVTELFLETGTEGTITGMSILAGVVCVFGGIALAVGLSRGVVGWITSLGSSRI